MMVLVVAVVVVLIISAGVAFMGLFSNKVSSIENKIGSGSITSGGTTDPFVSEIKLPNGLPNAITVDSSGNVWTILQNTSTLAVYNPSNGSLRQFPVSGLAANAPLTSWGIAVDNQHGLVWFTEEVTNTVWSFNISSQTFKMYKIATPESNPYQVAVDNRGYAWFTEFTGNKIGVVSPNDTINEFPIPIASANPTGITIDQKTNRIWFNLLDTSGASSQFYLGSLYDGSFTFNNITPDVDTPIGITLDSSGDVWMSQHGASLITEFNPITHYFRTISTSIPSVGASYPYFVYFDNATGMIWYNEHYGNAISVFDPETNRMIEYEIPSRVSSDGNISGALTMALSPSGTPWFTELYTGKIGEVNANAPVRLAINVSDTIVNLGNKSSVPIQLSIHSPSSKATYLSASLGNFTGTFDFNFTSYFGSGNYTTTMTIENGGSPPGVYFATISVKSENTIVSQVIEIKT